MPQRLQAMRAEVPAVGKRRHAHGHDDARALAGEMLLHVSLADLVGKARPALNAIYDYLHVRFRDYSTIKVSRTRLPTGLGRNEYRINIAAIRTS